ncbi:MAG: GAF domain-containing protein [Candidatus Heimdallarchaeota archaeon]|nr:GAF domain-containing protein [Candidatus Heimdallarchaeota archaeon]
MQKEEKIAQYKSIFERIHHAYEQELSPEEIYKVAIDELATIPYYDWTGIYVLDEEGKDLTLHPYYVGKHTDHVFIPYGKGVCGTAIKDHQDQIIKDVAELDNYLACSTTVVSEIVVLIEDENRIYAQIDIDSETYAAFDETDRVEMRKIADLIASKLK